jgi:hypothetical protein
MTNFRAMLGLISLIIIRISTLYFDSFISPRLIEIGFPKSSVGYLFAAGALIYILLVPSVTYLSIRIPCRYLTFLAFALGSVSSLLMGPSTIFGALSFDGVKTITLIGFLINGITSAFSFIP